MTSELLHIDSQFRSTGTNNSFTIEINRSIINATAVRIVNVEIPFTWYHITAVNNILDVTQTAVAYAITITPGNYTATELATALQTGLIATIGAGFTVVYDTNTYKLTFAHATAFTLDLASGPNTAVTISAVIGYPTTDQASSTSHTSTNVISLAPRCIFVVSNELSGAILGNQYSNHRNNSRLVSSSILIKIPITAQPGDTLFYEGRLDTHKLELSTPSSIDSIDFSLVDENDNVLDLNGANWCLSLIFTLTHVR